MMGLTAVLTGTDYGTNVLQPGRTRLNGSLPDMDQNRRGYLETLLGSWN